MDPSPEEEEENRMKRKKMYQVEDEDFISKEILSYAADLINKQDVDL